MDKKNNKKILILVVLILFISIGYAYLSSNLNIEGLSIFKKNKWEIYFDNLVDDSENSETSIPATIKDNKMEVDFEVTLSKPGDEYYFYVDVVNAGTIDAMLDTFEITGLTDEQKKYLTWSVTYSDGIELSQYDLLPGDSKDTLKILVQFKEDISISDLASTDERVELTYTSTYVQADTNGQEREHVEDIVGPVTRFSEENLERGQNGWYKNLSIRIKNIDSSGVKSVKYCVTTNDTCTPNTAATITNNSFLVDLDNSSTAQKICVEAIDNKDNSKVTCSNETYKVDSDNPTVSAITATPDDDTLRVDITGSDATSGVSAYYFSKDAGATYVKSTSPNYTFTGLKEADYLVTGYVEDKAGNTSDSKPASATIRHKSYCEKNGITNLGDCIIATETKNTNIEQAKSSISSKGTPDFTITAPAIQYSEVHSAGTSTYDTTTYQRIGTGYSFNPNTGYYNLTGSEIVDPTTIDYSTGEHYTCTGNSSNCTRMYKVTGATSSLASNGTITYILTKYNYATSIKSYDNNGSGMYATNDDEGTSYYYRGAVGGNYVKFANKYWRIIRINGDGSVRLIYDGTSAHLNGESSTNRQVTTRPFNLWWSDNAYVGYMHGDTSTNVVTEYNVAFNYNGLSTTAKYWFGTEKIANGAGANSFSVGGTKYQLTPEEYKESHSTEKLYTCFSTSETATCQRINHVQKYVSPTSMSVTAVEYGSISKESAEANIKNSTIKGYLDSWYTSELQSYASKLSTSSSFCGDREISTYQDETYKNTGYGATPTIYGHERFNWWGGAPSGPRVTCSKTNDKYTVASAATGNKALTYPIGLITADEVNMAGGKASTQNLLYYLYSGTSYWTMSPSIFSDLSIALVLRVESSGALSRAYTYDGYGVRPVVNIRAENITFTGSGTKEDPYVIE